MADDKDLNLNSLDRYSKHSPRFVLEEYSHCEVPAGCGGVVLRWRNPEAGVPVEIWHFESGKLEALFIDGVQQTISRPLVPTGQHVLSLQLAEINPQAGFLMLCALYRAQGSVRGSRDKSEVQTHFLSAADGSWKYSLMPPADESWKALFYDDSQWLPLLERTMPPPKDPRYGDYRQRRIEEYGGIGLGLPPDEKEESFLQKVKTRFSAEGPELLSIWVRKAFTILPEARPLSLTTDE